MEKKVVYLWSVIVLLSVVLSSALTLDIPVYFKVGGSLELRPQPEHTAITGIVWRHNGDLVAEWVDKDSPLTYWGVFKGRTTLNTTTGRLEIRKMSKDDAGLFTVEINKVQNESYAARVVKEVSKPTVLVKPLACSPALESCVLSCDGDTTETGPVDYYWKFGDGGWKQREKDITINKTEEMQSAKTVSCRMKNLAGEKDSDPVENPFFKEPNGSVGLGVGLFLLSVVVLAGGVVGYWKRESIKELVCPHNNGNNGDASNRQCDGTLQESQQLNDVEKSDKDGKVTQ
uniref:Ig-like domain-containing protein n=1 Tax=Monopterus albus TaxID=43700 RepID=A0A3Q3JKQ6_MONAL